MESLILKRIAGLITANAGLRIRDSDYSHLAETLWARVKSCGLRTLEDYYALLIRELDTTNALSTGYGMSLMSPTPRLEWHNLFTQLTVNESYFFRDRNQFQLIAQTVLPAIIDRKQRDHERSGRAGLPRLRIWSAGCSTGEELYSIAIALHELNFPWQSWDTLLIGTDISVAALSAAQMGCYGNWSFRQTDPAIQAKYFRYHRQSLQIRDDIRQQVTFQYGNLVQDKFPATQTTLQEIDLILCRNVFIYFDSGAIARTLDKFHRTLTPGGYLITGHTELYGQDTSQFHLKIFPESLLYQCRKDSASKENSQPSDPSAQPALGQARKPLAIFNEPLYRHQPELAPASKQPSNTQQHPQNDIAAKLAQAQAHLESKAYRPAILQLEQICLHDNCNFEAHVILAKAYANVGEHQRAKDFCKQALRLEPLNLELHYLLAQIAEEEGNSDLAKEHLRRIVYIDSYEFKAYLELASIYRQERRLDQVQRMERLALKTLNLLPETVIVDPETGSTVLEWRQHLEKVLKPSP